MSHTPTALVIGGGIAGPATAMALQKAGMDAVVYEARPAGAEGIGAFLTLASNGIAALNVLDAAEPALAAGFPTPWITLRSHVGKRLGRARTGLVPPEGIASHTIRRSDLADALHEQAVTRGIRVERGRQLVAAEDTGDGVRAVFADGTEASGDVLIGCDGVHSAVRRVIDPGAPVPTYARLLNTGGFAHEVTVESEPGSYEMLFGRRAFFGYAAAPDGEVWWFANVPTPREPSRRDLAATGSAAWRHRLHELFADDSGPAGKLIEATPELIPVSAIHSIPHLPRWHRGRLVVIGDAAHAPSPSSGQGASLALEDAVALAQCLRDEAGPQVAFARFEGLRRERVERIIKWAARVNNAKAPGPVGRALRNAMMPTILKLTADSKAQREIYEHEIAWHDGATIPA